MAGIGKPVILIVMGVSGSGKTTIGELLAKRLDCAFREGDSLHPASNVAKMSAGNPLTDEDRIPWLTIIAGVIDQWRAAGQSGVLTCSALKRKYRDLLDGGRPEVRFVYCKGSKELIRERITARKHHFMPASLLDSQFATLEEPTADEPVAIADIAREPEEAVEGAMRQLS